MAIINQIKNIVNDAVQDALGRAAATQLSTTDFVSMGKQIAEMNLYDKWYGALVNRITGTIFAVREYEPNSRQILRDEDAFGAFKQKVHYHLATAVDNPAQQIPPTDGQAPYTQKSPYDVNTTLNVKAIIFGTQGTWSIEVVRPIEQIMTAFTGAAEMAAFIDGLYVYIENSFKLEMEAIERAAANTAIARTLKKGKKRNLLAEYNGTQPAGTTALTVANCMTNEGFLKFASKEINDTLGYMSQMSTLFNEGGMPKFTPRDRAVVEMLHTFASASEMYLQSDTFHRELVELPGFNDIPFWQTSGNGFAFADVSSINVQHDDLITEGDDNDTGAVSQSGIICFIHDIDAVAAFFGYRRTWEEVNNRSNVVVHGEQARKGYAVDPNENMVVFYVADAA